MIDDMISSLPIRYHQRYIHKGIGRQGIGSFVRGSHVSTLRPVAVRPYLCTSEAFGWVLASLAGRAWHSESSAITLDCIGSRISK